MKTSAAEVEGPRLSDFRVLSKWTCHVKIWKAVLQTCQCVQQVTCTAHILRGEPLHTAGHYREACALHPAVCPVYMCMYM